MLTYPGEPTSQYPQIWSNKFSSPFLLWTGQEETERKADQVVSLASSQQSGALVQTDSLFKLKRCMENKINKGTKRQNRLGRRLGYRYTTFVGNLPTVSPSLERSLRGLWSPTSREKLGEKGQERRMSPVTGTASLVPNSNVNFQSVKHLYSISGSSTILKTNINVSRQPLLVINDFIIH